MAYEIHNLTGNQLVDANGRVTGNESAGVVSQHGTYDDAERAIRRLRRIAPLGAGMEIRETNENHPAGCSCGSPDCPEWQAAALGL